MSQFYILDGHEVVSIGDDVLKWGRMFEDGEKRRVAHTVIGDVRISTVFLGMDLGVPWNNREPLVFESMIFGGKFDQEQRRYTSWELAEKGHLELVAKVQDSDLYD